MAGGDYALIKAVEGFEDYTAFGQKQIRDLGVREGDVVFAITEGGETSFVIGTAWEGADAGARVYFVYNNPDGILCRHVERSREVLKDDRIQKLNLTTGPMAISGSTRMQATTIQLCVLVTVLEVVVRRLTGCAPGQADSVPRQFQEGLTALHQSLLSRAVLPVIIRQGRRRVLPGVLTPETAPDRVQQDAEAAGRSAAGKKTRPPAFNAAVSSSAIPSRRPDRATSRWVRRTSPSTSKSDCNAATISSSATRLRSRVTGWEASVIRSPSLNWSAFRGNSSERWCAESLVRCPTFNRPMGSSQVWNTGIRSQPTHSA